MLRTIEKHQNCVIQKVYKANGEMIAYQAGIIGDASSITRCSTLAEARRTIGVVITPPSIHTKPKMENPQNQKGYSAQRR